MQNVKGMQDVQNVQNVQKNASRTTLLPTRPSGSCAGRTQLDACRASDRRMEVCGPCAPSIQSFLLSSRSKALFSSFALLFFSTCKNTQPKAGEGFQTRPSDFQSIRLSDFEMPSQLRSRICLRMIHYTTQFVPVQIFLFFYDDTAKKGRRKEKYSRK